jgi:DNA-binding beta-propeller fold protein YncE
MTTVAGSSFPEGDGPIEQSRFAQPSSLALLGYGLLCVADSVSGRVRALDVTAGWVDTRVGYPNGYTDEPAAALYSRLLLAPRGIAYDSAGSGVFVSEYSGHTIRRVDVAAATWTISTLAGELSSPGYSNATGTAAHFTNPSGLAFEPSSRTLYVADSGNHIIRTIDVDSGAMATVAGTPRTRGFYGEGVAATEALLNEPQALAFGLDGSLYIADTGNHRVRRVDPSGVIDTVLGDGTPASSGEGGPARYFPVNGPLGLTVDSYGNLFVSSSTALREVTAGADGLATGDDEVLTIYGRPPRQTFPEPVTFCLAGIAVLQGDFGNDDRLYVLDACAGYLMQLDREAQ